MTSVTIQAMVERWSSPDARPLFKGSLIASDGCCCAQGDVLRCAGWTDDQLRAITQAKADKAVAELLGISRLHAVMLRYVNDTPDGCPQDILANPEKVLGPHANLVLAFGRHIDSLDSDGWERVRKAWSAAWDARAAPARAAGDAAVAAAARAAGDAAAGAAWDGAAWAAAWSAARELVGWSKLNEPFFLKVFFDDPAAWVAGIEAASAAERSDDAE